MSRYYSSLAVIALALMAFCSVAGAGPKRETLSGKLVVPRGANTPESYLTGNFQLIQDGKTLIVSSSETVSEEKMLELKDQMVTVEAELVPAHAPQPGEAAPIGPSGPLDHPAYYRLLSIKPAKK